MSRWTAERVAEYHRWKAKPGSQGANEAPPIPEAVQERKSLGEPVWLSLRTVSLTNRREHWSTRSKRAKIEREAALWAVRGMFPAPMPPCVVQLSRIAPRQLDDDNLRSALKAVRDGVADALGVDDGHPSVQWCYAQRKCGHGQYAVELRFG